MRSKWAGAAVLGLMVGAAPAFAQQPTMEDLMRRIDALQQRVNELERERSSGNIIFFAFFLLLHIHKR